MMATTFADSYRGRRVFVTGHTGFKGAWLALWLSELGADVIGYALAPPTTPSLFGALGLGDRLRHVVADVRDRDRLAVEMRAANPSIVLHLAAQALVRQGYVDPHGTYETNVMGTVNVLEAARHCDSVDAVVVVTSDKCYENREGGQAFREGDPLGGRDPYSSSKGCAELISAAYAASYPSFPGLASVRAGNVIGGGDWAPDRIIPDCVRSLSVGMPLQVRNPRAVRPWQHVLEPLSGYLWLAATLATAGGDRCSGAWNFGPGEDDAERPVRWVVEEFQREWGSGEWVTPPQQDDVPYEAHLLALDTSKATRELQWRPVWDARKAVQRTASWYRGYYDAVAGSVPGPALTGECEELTLDQLHAYEADARSAGLAWARGGPGGETTHDG